MPDPSHAPGSGSVEHDPSPSAGLAYLVHDAVRQGTERRRLQAVSGGTARRPYDATLPGKHPDRLEEMLDEALEETSSRGDPVSVRIAG
ncbi:hypothetical protein [Methylobacterium flocculans]|uniref:hypothetical protein n=1 Tax=Methylobacterium flocculans TaxID=2984843 RepID=UPI0021F25118|nr:hypothetical protein [Methylobacterium sp. FF17]